MDNPFRIKLVDICAQANGSDEERASAVKRCTNLGLSDREEFVLDILFSPTQESVLIFLDLYEIYLPYLRGAAGKERAILDVKTAESLNFAKENLDSVAVFGMLLRSIFLWNGDLHYEAVAREVARKLEAFTENTFDFYKLDESWADIYYKLSILLLAENLPAMERSIQMFFVGSRMFLDAIILGIEVEEKINQSVDYYVYLAIRFDLSTDFATFIYANEQTIGFNPTTGEPVKLDYWIDQYRIYSEKKFDSLSLINFSQDEKVWGEFNDSFTRMIVKSALMIYGHLVNGFYVYPPVSEAVLGNVSANKKKAELTIVAPVITTSGQPINVEIKKMVQDKVLQFSDNDKPAEIINFLSELVEKYNDPTIADLYYFDEQTGEFKWRE